MTTDEEPRTRTMVEALIAIALFGCLPVVIKFVTANPFTIGIVRLSVATAGVAIVMRNRVALREVPRSDIMRLAIIGFFFFSHWLTYFLSIKISSASVATVAVSTYGIQLLILGAIFGRSRLHVLDLIAVLIAIAGAILAVKDPRLSPGTMPGMLLGIVSATFYSTQPLLHRRWSHMSSSLRALGQFGFALVFFLCFLPKAEWSLRPIDWAGLAFLALGPTLVGHSLWVRVTTKLRPETTSIVYYGTTPIAIGLSVVLLGEPLTPRLLAGAILIIGGSLLGLTSQWRRSR